MIRVAAIYCLLFLDTTSCAGGVSPRPSARIIAGRARSMQHRGLQSMYDCEFLERRASDTFATLFEVTPICKCSFSGSSYTLVCQSGSEICCGDICRTIKQTTTRYSTGSPSGHEQICSKFTTPADLAGNEQCTVSSYCSGIGTSSLSLCSCSAHVDGQSCGSCRSCAYDGEPSVPYTAWPISAANCTNIAGFEDFPADCEGVRKLLPSACTRTAPPSAAPPPTSTSLLSLDFVPTILVAIFLTS